MLATKKEGIMTSLPYMQLYVSDYLADTAHLNAQQHGAYMLLLMNYWQRAKSLDNTNDRLAFVARMNPDEWFENKEVLAEFFIVEGDIWTHSRIELDLLKVQEKSAKASLNGRLSGVKRSLNYKDKDKDKEEDKDITSFEQFWGIYPRKAGKQDAQRSFERALKVATLDEILAGAQKYADDPNREAEFTAHPSTWLNQGRWSDEPLPSKRSKDARSGLITTPTIVPPRFTADDAPDGVPMPDSVRDLFRRMSDLP